MLRIPRLSRPALVQGRISPTVALFTRLLFIVFLGFIDTIVNLASFCGRIIKIMSDVSNALSYTGRNSKNF